MKVKLIVEGGKMAPGPAVAQQLGPMGINLGKVISDINEATKGFAGVKVPVELDVDPKTKKWTIQVFTPPISEMIKKELKIDKGSATPNTTKVGNISVEQLIGICEAKMTDMLAKDMKAALKLSVGSCVSLGILVDNKEAKEIETEIDNGNYENEINNKITTLSPEKKEKLDKFFKLRVAKQDQDQKALAEAAAIEEEEAKKKADAAAEAAPPATATATAATDDKKK